MLKVATVTSHLDPVSATVSSAVTIRPGLTRRQRISYRGISSGEVLALVHVGSQLTQLSSLAGGIRQRWDKGKLESKARDETVTRRLR
jgi:hypothetical protein